MANIKPKSRESIKDAAQRLFIEHGYQAVSVAMIAKELQLHKSALYHHFESKEMLFLEIVLEKVGEFRKMMSAVLLPDVIEVESRLRNAISLYYAYFDKEQELPNLLMQKGGIRGEEKFMTAICEAKRNIVELWLPYVKQRLKDIGRGEADPLLTTMMLFGLMNSMSFHRQTEGLMNTDVEQFTNHVMYFLS